MSGTQDDAPAGRAVPVEGGAGARAATGDSTRTGTAAGRTAGSTGGVPLHDFLALGFTWEEGPGDTAAVHMALRPEALGFTGNVHGGAIATMVDLACALAAARCIGFDASAESLVTADMHIRYLGTPRGDGVVARSRVVRAGAQLIVIDCQVLDGERLVAAADVSMMRVPRRGAPTAPEVSGPS